MLYTFVLVFHILVACVTIGALVCTVYALVRGSDSLYKRLAVAIGILAGLETVSGFALATLSPTLSVSAVGLHLLAYVGVCLAAEGLLLFRMRKVWIG